MYINKILLFVTLAVHNCLSQEESVETNNGKKKLVGVAVLFRHGDRAPIASFPKDQYLTEENFPNGFGQLLKEGAARESDLGRYFKSRYSDFLTEPFKPTDIQIISSDERISVLSAANTVIGIIRPEEKLEARLKKNPSRPATCSKKDSVLTMSKKCFKYWKMYDQQYHSLTESSMATYHEFYHNISKYTGWSPCNISCSRLYDIMYTYMTYNPLYLPNWYQQINQTILERITSLELSALTSTPELKRLGAGRFYKDLLDHFDLMFNYNTPKFVMYAGFDVTIVSTLNAVGAFDGSYPDFTSTVIWELYERDNGKNFVSMFYKKNVTCEATNISVGSCGFECSYNKFKRMLRNITIDSGTWARECQL